MLSLDVIRRLKLEQNYKLQAAGSRSKVGSLELDGKRLEVLKKLEVGTLGMKLEVET